MNTDNTSISGETIDYGPCAFLDEYDPSKKFSSIDHGGRYAFANQPRIAQWNLARLAEALLPLLAEDEEEAVRAGDRAPRAASLRCFDAAHARVLRAKLGLSREEEDDVALAADLLERLAANERRLHASSSAGSAPPRQTRRPTREVAALFAEPGAFHDWAEAWRRRLAEGGRRRPKRARARCAASTRPSSRATTGSRRLIAGRGRRGDFAPFETLVQVLERPYDDQPELADLAEPPRRRSACRRRSAVRDVLEENRRRAMSEVTNDTAQSRYELEVDGEVAVAHYLTGPGRLVFTHTVVPAKISGRGVASTLIRGALDAARAENLKSCRSVRSSRRSSKSTRSTVSSQDRASYRLTPELRRR